MKTVRRCRIKKSRPAELPPVPDRTDYDKQIDALIKFAYDEYRQVGLDRTQMQLGLVRTYLWVASASMALEGSVIQNLLGVDAIKTQFFTFTFSLETTVAVIACFMAFWAFVMGVDTLRGRSDGILPFGKFTNTATMIHTSCFSHQANSTESRISLLQGLDEAISHYNTENIQRSKKLRSMSRWLLCSSFLFLLFIGLNFYTGQQGGDSMPDESKSEASKPAPQAPPPSPASQPQAPPESIRGGSFGLNPSDGVIIITPKEELNR